jgi:cytochrome c biogenesis protein CcmG, thiol:disulfide interchange protein DsbE
VPEQPVITARQRDRPGANAGWAARLRALSRTRKIIYTVLAVVVLVAAAVLLTVIADPGGKAAPRQPPLAKSFSLPELGHPGASVSLVSYAGRPLIVNFFASWCSPCQRETPMLARFYSGRHGKVIVVGIDSNDEAAAALRFLQKAGVRYPVGFDPFPASTTTSYGVYALPQTFFLNAQHRIVSHVLGPLTMNDLVKGVALMDSGHSGSAAGVPKQDRG